MTKSVLKYFEYCLQRVSEDKFNLNRSFEFHRKFFNDTSKCSETKVIRYIEIASKKNTKEPFVRETYLQT